MGEIWHVQRMMCMSDNRTSRCLRIFWQACKVLRPITAGCFSFGLYISNEISVLIVSFVFLLGYPSRNCEYVLLCSSVSAILVHELCPLIYNCLLLSESSLESRGNILQWAI
jgi:hypothetical protein